MVKETIEKYEIELTDTILKDKNGGKKLWIHINNLSYKIFYLHHNDGDIKDQADIKYEIENFWKPIYYQHENKILT